MTFKEDSSERTAIERLDSEKDTLAFLSYFIIRIISTKQHCNDLTVVGI